MARILITDGMDKSGVENLIKFGFEVEEKFYKKEELGEALKNFDVVVVRSATKITKDIIDIASEAKRLKLIIRGGVGVDNIDVKYAVEKGIKVANTPKASSISVAELTIGHMLSVARFIGLSNSTMREGKWEKKKYEGNELYGKTLGLVGFGRIAREVAIRAEAFGMKVLYNNRSGKVAGYDKYEFRQMSDIIKEADFISFHIPFNKSQGAIIGEEQINNMKQGVYIINSARGGVVDETALLNGLNSGKVAGAALDVYYEEPTKNLELINHPRVSVTPHIGASTVEAQQRIGEEIVDIILENFLAPKASNLSNN